MSYILPAVQNHGVDDRLVEDMFQVNKAFFALPTEEKLKIATDKNFRGYTPMKASLGVQISHLFLLLNY